MVDVPDLKMIEVPGLKMVEVEVPDLKMVEVPGLMMIEVPDLKIRSIVSIPEVWISRSEIDKMVEVVELGVWSVFPAYKRKIYI